MWTTTFAFGDPHARPATTTSSPRRRITVSLRVTLARSPPENHDRHESADGRHANGDEQENPNESGVTLLPAGRTVNVPARLHALAGDLEPFRNRLALTRMVV